MEGTAITHGSTSTTTAKRGLSRSTCDPDVVHVLEGWSSEAV